MDKDITLTALNALVVLGGAIITLIGVWIKGNIDNQSAVNRMAELKMQIQDHNDTVNSRLTELSTTQGEQQVTAKESSDKQVMDTKWLSGSIAKLLEKQDGK